MLKSCGTFFILTSPVGAAYYLEVLVRCLEKGLKPDPTVASSTMTVLRLTESCLCQTVASEKYCCTSLIHQISPPVTFGYFQMNIHLGRTKISGHLLIFRKFNSSLEGHPKRRVT
jgi:hypothetical protein